MLGRDLLRVVVYEVEYVSYIYVIVIKIRNTMILCSILVNKFTELYEHSQLILNLRVISDLRILRILLDKITDGIDLIRATESGFVTDI